jgi:hypothetical protein
MAHTFQTLSAAAARPTIAQQRLIWPRRPVKECLARLPKQRVVPLPRSIDKIRADHRWVEERAIDWSKAVVVVVDL